MISSTSNCMVSIHSHSLAVPCFPNSDFAISHTIPPCTHLLPDYITIYPSLATTYSPLLGFFTSSILANSTWTSTARNNNSTESEVWTQPFCRMITSIDQAGSDHEQECPPKKGWAVVLMEGWVWEMFIVPVSDLHLRFRGCEARRKKGGPKADERD